MRRHDRYWLRVIAIVLLLYFRSATIFAAGWDWHLRSEQTSHALLEFNLFPVPDVERYLEARFNGWA